MEGKGSGTPAGIVSPIPLLFLPFPIAFLAAALATDVLYCLSGASMWANASLWLLGASVVALPIAAMGGLAQAIRQDGQPAGLSGQQLGYLSAIGLVMLDWYPRYRYGTAVGFFPLGMVISSAALLLLVATLWSARPGRPQSTTPGERLGLGEPRPRLWSSRNPGSDPNHSAARG